MLCKDVLKSLPSYVLDELGLHERQEMDQHLRECVSCGRECGNVQSTVGQLQSVPALETSAERRERTLHAMREAREKLITGRRRFWFALRVATLTMAASVLVSFISAYYLFAKPMLHSVYELHADMIEGRAVIQRAGDHSWSPLKPGAVIQAGDWIATDASGRFSFRLREASTHLDLGILALNTNTRMKLSGNDPSGNRIFLLLDRGEMLGTLKNLGSRQVMIVAPDNDALILTGGTFETGLRWTVPADSVPSREHATLIREGVKLSELLEWVQKVTGRKITCSSPPLNDLYVNLYSTARDERTDTIDPQRLMADLESELERQNLVLVKDKSDALKLLAFVRDPVGGTIRGKLYARGISTRATLVGSQGERVISPSQEGLVDRTGFPRIIR